MRPRSVLGAAVLPSATDNNSSFSTNIILKERKSQAALLSR
jgi:hypothetical protein